MRWKKNLWQRRTKGEMNKFNLKRFPSVSKQLSFILDNESNLKGLSCNGSLFEIFGQPIFSYIIKARRFRLLLKLLPHYTKNSNRVVVCLKLWEFFFRLKTDALLSFCILGSPLHTKEGKKDGTKLLIMLKIQHCFNVSN